MTENDRCVLACYERIAALSESHGVYLVRHRGSGRVYVMKKLSVYDIGVFRRLRDAQIAGIPRIYELIEDGGELIVIEEYVGGRTIRSLLDDGNLFEEREALRIALRLCAVLSELHAMEPPIVCRDVKPSNIILSSGGGVSLVDMNAAKQFHAGRSEDTELIGTAGYAAPEQYGFGASDVRADVYAVGVLLNEMLLGVQPKAGTPQGRLGRIIRKCTMLDPKDRYPSVRELSAALGREAAARAGQNGGGGARSWVIPGFRRRDPSNMAAAIIGYGFIVGMGLTLGVEGGAYPGSPWVERAFFIVVCLLCVLLDFNYMNIWSVLRLDRIKSRALQTLLLIVLDAALTGTLLLTMAIILSVTGGS